MGHRPPRLEEKKKWCPSRDMGKRLGGSDIHFFFTSYFKTLAKQKQEQNSHKCFICRYLYKLPQEFLGRIRGYGVGPKENTALRHIYTRERLSQRPREARFRISSAHSPHWKDQKRPPGALEVKPHLPSCSPVA